MTVGLVLIVLLATSGVALAQPTWRVGWANDEFFNSDNQFTNGLFLQKHSELADSLSATTGTLAFGKGLAALVLPNRSDLHYRETWTLGHNMQTPDDIKARELIVNDVPFVSMIGWSSSFNAFNDREFTGFQTLLGWAGDLTLGEQMQKVAHKIVGASDPNGWDNQLSNEPLLNVYAMRKQKFFQNNWMDASWNLDAALGNFFTLGQAALEMRFGHRPAGFAPIPTPTGRSMDYDARIQLPGENYFYGSAMLRATGLVHALPRHGNLLRRNNAWTENEQIEPERLIGQLVLGLHYERVNWGLHFNITVATDSVNDNPEIIDSSNNFGFLVFEWKR